MIQQRDVAGVASLFAVVLWVNGCASGPSEGASPATRVPGVSVHMNTVGIIDPTLQTIGNERNSKIAIEQNRVRRSSSGTIEIVVVIRNRTTSDLQLEARSQFFDADQIPTENPSAWQRIFVPGNSVATYNEFSKRDAKNYYVELRGAR